MEQDDEDGAKRKLSTIVHSKTGLTKLYVPERRTVHAHVRSSRRPGSCFQRFARCAAHSRGVPAFSLSTIMRTLWRSTPSWTPCTCYVTPVHTLALTLLAFTPQGLQHWCSSD
jgi:hypothetical protein